MELLAYPAVQGNIGIKANNLYLCDTNIAAADITQITKEVLEGQNIKANDLVLITFTDTSDLYKVASDFSLKLYGHAA